LTNAQTQRPRQGYWIEEQSAGGEVIFAIVAPSGERLYSFTERSDAEADLAAR
jgi:hypothetical protein